MHSSVSTGSFDSLGVVTIDCQYGNKIQGLCSIPYHTQPSLRQDLLQIHSSVHDLVQDKYYTVPILE